jgi:hypothetical protein
MVLNAFVVSGFHLEALESVLCLGNSNIVLRHGISPFQIWQRGRQRGYLPYPPPRCRVRRNRQTAVQPFVSAIKLNRFIIGESRRNSIVDRVFENINRNFCQRTIYRINSDRV